MFKLLLITISLLISNYAFAAPVWTYQIKQVTCNGDNVQVIVTLYADGKEYAGREMNFTCADFESKTTNQLQIMVTEQVKYILTQDSQEYEIKAQLAPIINVAIEAK